jgi:aspartyl-tRNA(Asn)/glutamyl-tRNA(Gln) amidotransferase subunit A
MRITALAESFAIHADHLRTRPHDYGEVFRYRILPGALVTGTDYIQALRLQRVLTQNMLDSFKDVDLLVTSSTWGEAPVMAGMRAEANFAAPPLTNPWNVAQLPALSLCHGFSANGLPLSMQIAGRPFDEATVFRAGHAYERATTWRARRPVVPDKPLHDHPVDQAAPPPSPEARHAYATLAGLAALAPDERQFAQLCEAFPHAEAMAAVLPRTLPFSAEPATSVELAP